MPGSAAQKSRLERALDRRSPALPPAASLGGLGLLRRFFLNCGNVQAGHDNAALVVKPDHDPAALRVNVLESGPFEEFFIVTSSGNRYRVPSADHASSSQRQALNALVFLFREVFGNEFRVSPTFPHIE